MKLYFGNAVTTATTLMTLALLGFIGYSAHHHAAIACWGRRSAAALALGLAICCFAAARDGLDKTIQHICVHSTFTTLKSSAWTRGIAGAGLGQRCCAFAKRKQNIGALIG